MQVAIQLERRRSKGIEQEKLEIARQMLRKGYSPEAVQELTGLSILEKS